MSNFDDLPDLTPSTFEESAQMLAAHLPEGKAFDAKVVEGTKINLLVKGTSKEFSRVEQSFNELLNDFDITAADQTLSLWEESLGIPDASFSGLGSLAKRRNDVLIKFAKMSGTVTVPQWESLANALGFDIVIYYGDNRIQFPIEFPLPFYSAESSTFIWYVRIFYQNTTTIPPEDNELFLGFVNVINVLNPADFYVETNQDAITKLFP